MCFLCTQGLVYADYQMSDFCNTKHIKPIFMKSHRIVSETNHAFAVCKLSVRELPAQLSGQLQLAASKLSVKQTRRQASRQEDKCVAEEGQLGSTTASSFSQEKAGACL